MPTVQADKGDAWVIKDLIRKKFIQALDGKTITNPSAFVNSAEGQELLKSIQGEVEAFVGYTMEEAKATELEEDLAREIKYSSRNIGDEEPKDGMAEMEDESPESVML